MFQERSFRQAGKLRDRAGLKGMRLSFLAVSPGLQVSPRDTTLKGLNVQPMSTRMSSSITTKLRLRQVPLKSIDYL
jgi:hypothetical protein